MHLISIDIIDLLTSKSNGLFLRKFRLEQWDVRQHRKWISKDIDVLVSLCYRGKFRLHRKVLHVSCPFDKIPLRRMLFADLANVGKKNSKDILLKVAEHIEIENYMPNLTFANLLDLSSRLVQGSPRQARNYTIRMKLECTNPLIMTSFSYIL